VPIQELIELAKVFGVPVMLAIFLLWNQTKTEQRRDNEVEKREEQMTTRIQLLEDEFRTSYRGMVEQTTQALTENSATLRENSVTMREMVQHCKERVCAT